MSVLQVGIDIGGTFTDVVVRDATGRTVKYKALTTPDALINGIVECLDRLEVDVSRVDRVVHGTTVGVNAVIQRQGAKTALLTTAGFRDVLEIGRGNSRRIFDLLYKRPAPIVPRCLRLEVTERLSADGAIDQPLDEDSVRRAAAILREEDVEAIAIALLFSYVDPRHERRAAAIIGEVLPGIPVTMSHQVSREWREYERTSTAVLNAYVQPLMRAYLETLDITLRARGLRGALHVMQSNGGVVPVSNASEKPVYTLESGPAGGAIGCAALASLSGGSKLISFDMGGTTAKCCVVEDGRVPLTDEYLVDGQPVRIPVIDITEVSAGGGSIARVDAGGALKVGPGSAGASPGPACYGLGGQHPTVTDANLLAGRISQDAFMGGTMPLDVGKASDSMLRLTGERDRTSELNAVAGVLRLADVKMALTVRSITTERGLDPRDYTLVAYGGSGPIHAVAIAREIAVPIVVIPPSPSTFSAWGMLSADIRHDIVRTVLASFETTDEQWAERAFADLVHELHQSSGNDAAPVVIKAVDLRYHGRSHVVTIELGRDAASWRDLRWTFDTLHTRNFGYASPDAGLEILNLRVSLSTPASSTVLPRLDATSRRATPCATRDILSSRLGKKLPTPVYERSSLLAGEAISGPAAIEEVDTTTYLDVGDAMTVTDHGFLRITVASASIG